jgi:2-alkenal reductase
MEDELPAGVALSDGASADRPSVGETALAEDRSGDELETSAEAQAAPLGGIVALEAALEKIYRDVNPSVVNIQVVVGQGDSTSDGSDGPAVPQRQGAGSGFVWDDDGHIVTNDHVVDNATKITVVFSDGSRYRAKVVGADPYSDLAVVKIEAPAAELLPIEVADSREVNVGQLAVAIGNPFGLDGTMTVGFVSALGRSLPVASEGLLAPSYNIPDIIQTDAPINPGNSGGVLVNSAGRLIGVPSAIESPVRANAGIGFAIPSVIVGKVVPDLIATGSHQHPWVGFRGGSIGPELAEAMGLDSGQRGVLVAEVLEGSPAAEAGLRGSDREVEIEGLEASVGGDVIVAIDGQNVLEFDDLIIYLSRNTRVGQKVMLSVLREGRLESVDVVLAARPTD